MFYEDSSIIKTQANLCFHLYSKKLSNTKFACFSLFLDIISVNIEPFLPVWNYFEHPFMVLLFVMFLEVLHIRILLWTAKYLAAKHFFKDSNKCKYNFWTVVIHVWIPCSVFAQIMRYIRSTFFKFLTWNPISFHLITFGP